MMRSKRVRNRSKLATPTLSAAFACADVVVEATLRGLRRAPRATAAELALASASGQTFVILGRELEHRRRRMLAADDHYQELRSRLRRRRRRRDRVARRANRGLVAARKILKGLFGYSGACLYLGLRGPTEREPWALHLQLGEALWWARNHQAEVECLHAGAEEEAESCVACLEPLHQALEQALADVLHGDREVEAAMLEQRAAMADFDRTYKHVAGAIEARLIEVGLPTLAAAVRPGVGRRGRPLKRRPKDRHPDLVEQVREGGQVVLDDAAWNVKDDDIRPEIASSKSAGNGDAAHGDAATGARTDSTRLEKIERPLPKRSGTEEESQSLLHKRSADEEKSEHAFHKRIAGEEKSEHRILKPSGGDRKSAQPLRKPGTDETSALFSRLTLSPPLRSCAQDPRRRDLGRRGGTVASRPRGRSKGGSPVRTARAATSPWWRRLLRVA